MLNDTDMETAIQSSNELSGSMAETVISLNAITASLLNYTASNNAAMSDILLETASINTFTSSINSRVSVVEGRYATTGSNIFFGTQTITGSLFITNNLVVQGSSSLQNITASVVSIGTNTVILNTDTPAVRFGGIKVQDSGSGAGASGSLLWDSLNNHWIYQHPVGGAESAISARLISGPKNSGSLGNEAGITSGKIIVAVGDDHVGDSIMTESGTTISVAGSLSATSLTGSINGSQLTNATVANAKLANSTISGIALGSNLATLTIGTGLSGTSYNGSTGVTIANTGVTSNVAGTGISVSGATGAVTITNSGVTSIVAGTGISINQGTGAVTVTNTITNTNQLTNGAGYITSAGNAATATIATNVASPDGDRNPSTKLPTTNARNVRFDFSGAGAVGGAGNYAGVMTYAPWDGTSASTGDSSYQLAFLNETGVNASGNPGLSLRNGINSTWNGWHRIVTSANIASYTAGNVNSISSAVGGAYTWTGINYFQSNRNTSSDSPMLQAFSNNASGAIMAFHRGGYYAINFGLDSDNVIRMGGWSASTNRFQMDMSGNLTMAGDVTAYSDARVKENIKTIENALSKTLALRGVSYNRTDSEDKKTKIGVIAQETLPIVPEVVNQDNDGMYNVSYGNLAGLFIEAIKEQQSQIEELKSIINALTK